ncbi:unnamed protein product, partial [Didymodactylos carnosus]
MSSINGVSTSSLLSVSTAPSSSLSTIRNIDDRMKPIAYWRLLISPMSWFHCFQLLYQTQSYCRRKSLIYYLTIITLLFLLASWCTLYWYINFDSGLYLTLLADVSAGRINITDAKHEFTQIFWQTSIKALFIGICFGLIMLCQTCLAAQWRQRLCDQFHRLLFTSSSNGSVLYYSSISTTDDLSTILTNDIRQFTTHMCIALFGSLYFSGFISITSSIIAFSIWIYKQTQGDYTGLMIMFGTFFICTIFITIISNKFNMITAQQSRLKGELRSFLQRIQINSESISFYTSQLVEHKYFKQFQTSVHKYNLLASVWYGIVNLPLSMMDEYPREKAKRHQKRHTGATGLKHKPSLSGLITYVLPAVLFFFIRTSQSQTPTAATKYIGIIAFYGYVFGLMTTLVWITESSLIAVTMGHRIRQVKQR